ncbi:coiled-coil domain-containing protein [Thermodesulfovibrio sp. TK110]
MEWEKVVDRIRDLILGEIKEELRDFKATVTGQLQGFTIAIESINGRMNSIESRMGSLESRQANIESELKDIRRSIDETNKRIDETNKRIDETNNRIDELRVELKTEIMMNTQRIDETNKRIDETNKRIDELFLEVSKIRGDLNKALSQKEAIDDMRLRIQRLEDKVLVAA